jgi:hypothetical protein
MKKVEKIKPTFGLQNHIKFLKSIIDGDDENK